jgi:hypothetical protein
VAWPSTSCESGGGGAPNIGAQTQIQCNFPQQDPNLNWSWIEVFYLVFLYMLSVIRFPKLAISLINSHMAHCLRENYEGHH